MFPSIGRPGVVLVDGRIAGPVEGAQAAARARGLRRVARAGGRHRRGGRGDRFATRLRRGAPRLSRLCAESAQGAGERPRVREGGSNASPDFSPHAPLAAVEWGVTRLLARVSPLAGGRQWSVAMRELSRSPGGSTARSSVGAARAAGLSHDAGRAIGSAGVAAPEAPRRVRRRAARDAADSRAMAAVLAIGRARRSRHYPAAVVWGLLPPRRADGGDRRTRRSATATASASTAPRSTPPTRRAATASPSPHPLARSSTSRPRSATSTAR